MKPMTIARTFLAAALLALLMATDNPEPAAAADTGEKVYAGALKSTTYITYKTASGQKRSASGVLIDGEQRLVLTNFHVGDADGGCIVQFPLFENGQLVRERKRYEERAQVDVALRGKLFTRDQKRGIAIIQLDKLPKEAEVAKIAEKSLKAGASGHAIGNPKISDSLFSYASCEVRQVYPRKIPVLAIGKKQISQYEIDCTIIETDLALNEGDAGGPIFSSSGELVGVNFAGTMRAPVAFSDGSIRAMTVITLESLDSGDRLLAISTDISEVKNLLREKQIKIAAVSNIDPKKGSILKPDPKSNPTKGDEPKGATAEEEKKADNQLAFAKGLIDKNRDRALQRLEDIVKMYPNTKAARQAKDLIAELKK